MLLYSGESYVEILILEIIRWFFGIDVVFGQIKLVIEAFFLIGWILFHWEMYKINGLAEY